MNQVLFQWKDTIRAKGTLVLTCVLGLIFFLTPPPNLLFAQEKYPSKPINLLVGFAPGGGSDVVCRALAPTASKVLGQPIVVNNKPGGGSVVMISILKDQEPDGYTIGSLLTGPVAAQYLRNDVSYDTRKDFTPIIGLADSQYGLVVKSDSPWKTFGEFIDYAKANPGKIHYSTAGIGGPQHLVMERLAEKAKIKWTHVPFEGAMPATTALLGGHVEASSNSTEWKKFVESGRLRLLAVFAERRNPDFPNVPTLIELGYDITAPTISGIIGPKGMDPRIVETLHGAFKKAVEEKEFSQVLARAGLLVRYRNTADFAKYLVDLNDQLESIIRRLGLKQR